MFRKVLKFSLILPVLCVLLLIFYSIHFYNNSLLKLKHDALQDLQDEVVAAEPADVDNRVHAFYYAWYGNEEYDGNYYHWNHRIMPHWKTEISDKFPVGRRHKPPLDIASNFYPNLGTYSSFDPMIQKIHMIQLKKAKIGVLVLSWYPEGKSDAEGLPRSEKFIKELLDSAEYGGIKVCFHIEPYEGRTAQSVATDIKYLIEKFGDHGAMYRKPQPNAKPGEWDLPLFYIYDSYLIGAESWSRVLSRKHSNDTNSIRSSVETDAFVIGLLLKKEHEQTILSGGFDGFYTYFASPKTSWASDRTNWIELSAFATENKLLFIPSVSPGYIDTSIRPWNTGSTTSRDDGNFYRDNWRAAIASKPGIISITSFNEWGEGTQIEPAMNKHVEREADDEFASKYLSYASSPTYYLELTRQLADQF